MSSPMLGAEPLVSVILPASGPLELTERSLTSASNQSYQHCEIIAVDDGANPALTDPIARQSEAVRYLPLPHRGLAYVRNAAIRHSRGELIALLDPGDLWTTDKLEKCVRYLQAHPECDVVYSLTGEWDARQQHVSRNDQICHEGWILDELFSCAFIYDSSAVFHRRVWERMGGFDESLSEFVGHNFWLRVAVAHRFGLIAEPLTTCSTAAKNHSPEEAARLARILAEMLHRFFGDSGKRERLDHVRARRTMGRLCWQAGWLALQTGDVAYSARLFRGAVYYQPSLRSRALFAYADWRRRKAGRPSIETAVLQ